MSSELVYTSVPSGLKPGSKGFCTVAMTAGLSPAWIDRLESLSPYRAVYPLGDPKSDRNPINFSHWRVNVAGKSRSVLSRVAFDGADYSGRSNKLAHHVVLEPNEQAEGGPAWMLLQPGVMRTKWAGAPSQIPTGPKVPVGTAPRRICSTWAATLGDAGWAGALAKSFMAEPAKPAYLVYTPGTDVLKLFEESLSLLPPEKRWEVTFSTFFTDLPLNLACAWRAVVAGTPAALEALRLGPRTLLIDLTKPAATTNDEYADAARAGTGPISTDIPITRPSASSKKLTSAALLPGPDDTHVEIALGDNSNAGGQTEIKRRQKLASVSSATDDDEELIGYGTVVNTSRNGNPQQQAVPSRGVRVWIFILSIVGCLALGAASSGLAFYSFRKAIPQTQPVMPGITNEQLEKARNAAKKSEKDRIAATQQADKISVLLVAANKQISELEIATANQKGQIETLTTQYQKQKKLADELTARAVATSQQISTPADKTEHWEPVPENIESVQQVDGLLTGTAHTATIKLAYLPPGIATLTVEFPNGLNSHYSYSDGADVNILAERPVGATHPAVRLRAERPNQGGLLCVSYITCSLRDGRLYIDSTNPNKAELPKNDADSLGNNPESEYIELNRCVYVCRDANDRPLKSYSFPSELKAILQEESCRLSPDLAKIAALGKGATAPGWDVTVDTKSITLKNQNDLTLSFEIRLNDGVLSTDWKTKRGQTFALYTRLNEINQRMIRDKYKGMSTLGDKETALGDAVSNLKSMASNLVSYDSLSGDEKQKRNDEIKTAKSKYDAATIQFTAFFEGTEKALGRWQFPDFAVGIVLPNGHEIETVIVKAPPKKS